MDDLGFTAEMTKKKICVTSMLKTLCATKNKEPR